MYVKIYECGSVNDYLGFHVRLLSLYLCIHTYIHTYIYIYIYMSNATGTNYFTTFLQNTDVANLLLVFI